MVVGTTGSGKTTLLNALGLGAPKVRKTEMVDYSGGAIDTPGEMLDSPLYYHALITTSTKARLVLFIADPKQERAFPKNLALTLRAPSIGIITKADVSSDEEIERAKKSLAHAGLSEFYVCSAKTGAGMESLSGKVVPGGRHLFVRTSEE